MERGVLPSKGQEEKEETYHQGRRTEGESSHLKEKRNSTVEGEERENEVPAHEGREGPLSPPRERATSLYPLSPPRERVRVRGMFTLTLVLSRQGRGEIQKSSLLSVGESDVPLFSLPSAGES